MTFHADLLRIQRGSRKTLSYEDGITAEARSANVDRDENTSQVEKTDMVQEKNVFWKRTDDL